MTSQTETTAAKTTADQVAAIMGEDGQRFTAPDGRSLTRVCRDHGADVYRNEGGARRYAFPDGSRIAECDSGAAWDLVPTDCYCDWCWSEGELDCEESAGVREWRVTDFTAEDAEDERDGDDEDDAPATEPMPECEYHTITSGAEPACGLPGTVSALWTAPADRDSASRGARVARSLMVCERCARALRGEDYEEERAAGWLAVR